jgi:CRP-like cAMP-binding protein
MIEPALLSHYPFFSALTEAQLQTLAQMAEEVHQPENGALFYEGRPADTLWLVLEGGVSLRHSVEAAGVAHARATEAVYHLFEDSAPPLLEGQGGVFAEMDVGEIGPGEIVGISALIAPYRMTATARARQPSRLLRIDAVSMREACAQDAKLACALLQATARVALDRLHFARQKLLTERR